MKLGIDLGTSYSSVAAEVNGKIEVIKLATGTGSFGDSFSMPTAVYIDDGNILLGQAAYNKRKLSPASFKGEFKRDLGTTTPYILGGEDYLPEQLYTEFFLYFKNMATEQTGEKVEKVYITHPANYGNNKKRLIERAANNAGLFDVVLVDEPTAAAAGYAWKSRTEAGDILLIYDLGGGTFDVALIKKTAEGYVHLTEPLGISMCGGIDFDRAIFDDIMKKLSLCDTFDMDRLMKEKRFTAALSEICIQIKHQLSQADSHTEPIAVGFDYFDYTITRQEFEELIHPFIANTCEKVKDILKNSGLVASDIDRVLLVGGSSRVPLVRKMVHTTLQKDISLDSDPELTVCQGAVRMAIMTSEEKREEAEYKLIDSNKPLEWNTECVNDAAIKKQLMQSLVDILGRLRDEREKDEKLISEQRQRFIRALNLLKYKKSQEPEEEITKYPLGIRKLIIFVKLGINISDSDWIYYSEESKLFKINMDGTQKTLLSDRRVIPARIKLHQEWVYYLVREGSLSEGYSLYRIKKDGTEEQRISGEKIYLTYTISDQWIYFTTKSKLKKMRINGTGIITIDNEHYFSIKIIDEWIYYIDNMGSICRMHTDGTCKQNIMSERVNSFKILGDRIFYSTDSDKGVYSIKMFGSDKHKICNDNVGQWNICNGWLYYYNKDKEKPYRVFLDGGMPEACL